MDKKLIKILIDIGLNPAEAQAYLAMIAIGPSNMAKIAYTAEIKRPTMYGIVENLIGKGLARIELKGWKKLFVAENPEKLKSILEQRKEKLEDKLPAFLALYNLEESGATIKYYKGLEAVKSAYDLMLKDLRPKDYYLVLSDTERWTNLNDYFVKFVERRAKLPIQTRLILQDNEKAHYYKKYEKIFNFQVKLLPTKRKLTTNLNITSHKVLIHTFSEPTSAFIIETKDIILMHQEMFETLWENLK
jgi:sugar-specific transcriptional regulator TrmB